MAKHSSHILELARRGAQHRYAELKAELDSLIHHFPELARGVVKRGRKAIKVAEGEIAQAMKRSRVRRKMSLAGRKKIGDAQRKRWAKQRAAKN